MKGLRSSSWKIGGIIAVVMLLTVVTVLALTRRRAEYRLSSSCLHPANYAGPVWIKLKPQAGNLGKTHHYQVYWRPWLYTNQLDFAGNKEVILLHRKMGKGKSPRVSVAGMARKVSRRNK